MLDPYNINLDWNVLETAGNMKSIEIILNFSIMDMNMNVFRHDIATVQQSQIVRMNYFWGDESLRDIAYGPNDNLDLFGDTIEKQRNEKIAEAFRKRLKEKAGFRYVPSPLAMKNSTKNTVYYLFFASRNETGNRIAADLFKKYKNRM